MLARQANALAQGSHRGLEGCIETATDLQLLVCSCCCGGAAAVAAAGTAGSGRRRGWANKARGAVHGTGKAAERERKNRGRDIVEQLQRRSLCNSLVTVFGRFGFGAASAGHHRVDPISAGGSHHIGPHSGASSGPVLRRAHLTAQLAQVAIWQAETAEEKERKKKPHEAQATRSTRGQLLAARLLVVHKTV